MGLNVACFVFSDEMQIILKYLRSAEALHNDLKYLRSVEALHNDLMNIWNALMYHPIIEVLNLL